MNGPTSTIALDTIYTFDTCAGEATVEVRRVGDGDDTEYLGYVVRHPGDTDALHDVCFIWRGGGYIDFGRLSVPFAIVTPDEIVVADNFNIFDYEFDGILIDPTPAGFGEWLANLDDDDVARITDCIRNA
jgi:hypothetical protein